MKRAVVDQPGLKVIILGLVLSVILGLSIKSQISPRKIKSRLDKAISRLQPDVKIDFNSVQIKLSDWGWPQPYLEVHDIRVSPVKAICDESQLFIETLSFPLSWNILFDSKKIIKSLRMSQLEIRLSEFKNCFGSASSESISESVLRQGLQQVFSAPNAEQLQELKIDRIKILSKDNYQMPLYLQAAVFEFSYANQMLSKIFLKAQTVFYNDNQKQLFKIKSDLNLNFEKKNTNEVSIQGQLNGKIIDRDYKIQFDYVPGLNSFYILVSGQKISVKSLYKVFHLDHLFSDSVKNELMSYYLTLKGAGTYNLNQSQFEQFQFSDLRIESDTSSITSTQLGVQSIQPFVVKTGSFQILKLKMDSFFSTLLRDLKMNDRIVEAGQFDGEVHFVSQDEFKANGEVNNIKLRIGPKEKNLNQMIDKMSFNYTNDPKIKRLNLEHFVINERDVKGIIKYQSIENRGNQFSLEIFGDFLSEEIRQELWGTEMPTDLVFKMKIENDRSQYDLTTKKMTFKTFKLNDVIYSVKSEGLNTKPLVLVKVANVAWDEVPENEQSEMLKFYLKNINLKKIEAEGFVVDNQYQVSIPLKSGKLKLNLDFLNDKFKISE